MNLDPFADSLAYVADGLAKLSPDAWERLDKTVTLDFETHFAFQEAKSLAYASGKIALSVATWLYNVLGSTESHFNGQPLHTRIVAMQAMGAIIPKREKGQVF